MKILVETSARHIHLSLEDLEMLFGKGAELTFKCALSQPGQFASNERVDITGSKGTLKNVIILGPTRPQTQVEVSLTDARVLGVSAPIKESGDLVGSAAITITGPNGEIDLTEGLIAAKRHIHTTPEDAALMGVSDKEVVMVRVDTDGRSNIFDDVVIRVSASYATAMHIDTDESNAINGGAGIVQGEVLKKKISVKKSA